MAEAVLTGFLTRIFPVIRARLCHIHGPFFLYERKKLEPDTVSTGQNSKFTSRYHACTITVKEIMT